MRAASFVLLLCTATACSSIYRKSEKAVQLPPAEYLQQLAEAGEAHRLDIRTPMEYRKGHLEGFANVNYLSFSFGKQVDSLDRDRPVFIYCATAHRSPLVARALLRRGFEEVIDLAGGYKAYRKSQEAGR
jgi:rhodanese-related sulfurtransferase